MATIGSVRLELLEHDPAKRTATVRVSYNVRLSALEAGMTGLRYQENIQLWGEDSPDPDDFLFQFATATFPTERDGNVARVRTAVLGDDILDEDGFPRPTDEVYARVVITPLLPSGSSARSNTIEHSF
jgi:hypothetical protein